MRRLMMLTTVVLVMAAMMVAMAAPAFAAHQGTGGPPPPDTSHPFCTSGEEYAHGHIVPLAQNQQIMAPEAGGVHNPGLAHEGFAVCDPPAGE
jgi:hypothetical protein